MTCKEVHDYWQGNPQMAFHLSSGSAELAEHVATCPECNRFIKGKRELAAHLNVVRDSAPAIPASLDAAVVANYRSYLRARSFSTEQHGATRPRGPGVVFGWAAALAFTIIVAYGGTFFLVSHPNVWIGQTGQPVARQPLSAQATNIEKKKKTAVQKFTQRAATSHGYSARRAKNSAPSRALDYALPAQFQSLIYCDQISCSGAMNVIRVRLPSPVFGLTAASARTNGAVSADVLVGADGIARGIRVVE